MICLGLIDALVVVYIWPQGSRRLDLTEEELDVAFSRLVDRRFLLQEECEARGCNGSNFVTSIRGGAYAFGKRRRCLRSRCLRRPWRKRRSVVSTPQIEYHVFFRLFIVRRTRSWGDGHGDATATATFLQYLIFGRALRRLLLWRSGSSIV